MLRSKLKNTRSVISDVTSPMIKRQSRATREEKMKDMDIMFKSERYRKRFAPALWSSAANCSLVPTCLFSSSRPIQSSVLLTLPSLSLCLLFCQSSVNLRRWRGYYRAIFHHCSSSDTLRDRVTFVCWHNIEKDKSTDWAEWKVVLLEALNPSK